MKFKANIMKNCTIHQRERESLIALLAFTSRTLSNLDGEEGTSFGLGKKMSYPLKAGHHRLRILARFENNKFRRK